MSSDHSSSSSHRLFPDDIALELMLGKEARSEVERLRSRVTKLEKEIEAKDAIIARLWACSGSTDEPILSKPHEPCSDSGSVSASKVMDATSKPAPADTMVQAKQSRDVALQCNICVDYFSSPFTIECGHTFCYECLHAWLEIQKSCPTCRAKLLRRPTLSFSIREQVLVSISRLPEPDRKEIMGKVQAGEDYLNKKQRHRDPWERIFRPAELEGSGITIVDQDDGVSGAEDSDNNSQENTDRESEYVSDSYDSHDSFIDDSVVVYDNGSEKDSDENDLDLSDESPDSDREHDSHRQRAAGSADLDEPDSNGDSDTDHTTRNHSYNNRSSEEVEEAQVIRSRGGRHQTIRRAIMISDDDDGDGDDKDDEDKNKPNRISRQDEDKHGSDNSRQGKGMAASSSVIERHIKRAAAESDSDEADTSDDDFATTASRRSKMPRRGYLQSLFM
ncbi:E3 ubiquitin ligase [Modicella reniformis]|uniref:E3 ubiquitin ligase n=1 Tax=Modicella reniformis TaxID=1440133 RepID=A0A9P6LWD6_9FUNG|nr:E3 ubiquitin ligase [Modicella reniformis]